MVAVKLAEHEAAVRGKFHFDAEDLLLAILKLRTSAGARICARYAPVGLLEWEIKREREETVILRPPEVAPIVDVAQFIAGTNRIGTEQLLLGLLSSRESLARNVLTIHGITLETCAQDGETLRWRDTDNEG
jgi:hypothetical protein